MQRLVVPRVLASMFVALLLNGLVCTIGIAGGFAFSVFLQDVNPGAFVNGITLLTGLAAPAIGTFLVQRRLALLGDGTHVVTLDTVIETIRQTGADMLMWDGACIVHEEFKARGIEDLKRLYPEAAVLVHPESPEAVVKLADVAGSTSQLIKAAQTLPNDKLIVATDRGIFFKMQQAVPGKTLFEAPTAGNGATCRSCAHCPWMAMNELDGILEVLQKGDQEIHVDPALAERAKMPLDRMLAFSASLKR